MQGSAAHDAMSGTPRTQSLARTWRASLEPAEPHSVSATSNFLLLTTYYLLLPVGARAIILQELKQLPPSTPHPPLSIAPGARYHPRGA